MDPTFGYHIHDRVFHTRLDFIEYCEKHNNPGELFNTGEFQVYNLPTHIDNNEMGNVTFPDLSKLNPKCKIFNYHF